MTELSPAAQAVLDAYLNAPCGKPSQTWVAAALRAVADQLTFKDSLAGDVINPRELHAIADELESQQ